MSDISLSKVLRREKRNLALIIGNGINKYGSAPATNSWTDLLITLSQRILGAGDEGIPTAISNTEFYDLLELQLKESSTSRSLQKEFCDLMRTWTPAEHHRWIVAWAQRTRCPILTTNFETVLSDAAACTLYRTKTEGFTDYYPWDSYYGNSQFGDPCGSFGIWHINGMALYPRSIRLGLTHYMGSAEKARSWMYKGGSRRLFSGESINHWKGCQTWLQTVFCRSLIILGLALEQNEVFLRWLLIERARYFRSFPDQRKAGWYFYAGDKQDPGKLLFLQRIGIRPVRVQTYDDIYGVNAWAAD